MSLLLLGTLASLAKQLQADNSLFNDLSTSQWRKWMGDLLSEPELLKKGRSLLRCFGKRLNDRPVPAVLLVHLLPSPSSPIGPSPPIALQSYWLFSSHPPVKPKQQKPTQRESSQRLSCSLPESGPRPLQLMLCSNSSGQNRSKMTGSLRTRRWSRALGGSSAMRDSGDPQVSCRWSIAL